MSLTFESLPVELVADVLSELDLSSLITVASLSKRLRSIVSDPSLNPWRKPILRTLTTGPTHFESSIYYESPLKNLAVHSIVPRHNWIEILSLATPSFLLFDAVPPNLKETEWEEAFRRRFLPGWKKWKKDGMRWKETFLKTLWRVHHRSGTSCTADEAWTKFVVLNRNGSANEREITSRGFNPMAVFNEIKLQNNLAHLETRIRLVVEFSDVRILAFGVLNRPRTNLTVNKNARALLHPPGIPAGVSETHRTSISVSLAGSLTALNPVATFAGDDEPPASPVSPLTTLPCKRPIDAYERLSYPIPAHSHANYPFYTPGGGDTRWLPTHRHPDYQEDANSDDEEHEEGGLKWVGPMMLVTQLLGPTTHEPSSPIVATTPLRLRDLDLVLGPGRNHYGSFTWSDLFDAVGPWMEERIPESRRISGEGLGN